MIEIGGLQKTTLIDFPGRVAATVFLLGCNFRCPFCYSAELVLPEKIKLQPRISEKDFFDFLEKRKGLLEGVVICGGEPTIHIELIDFIGKIKEMGYLIKLDTNGSNPGMVKKLIDNNLLDYIAMDIKSSFRKYDKATGIKVNLHDIKESIGTIKNSGLDYEFRMTVVPSFHEKEDVIQIAEEIGPAKKFFLQSFLPEKTIDPDFEKIKPYSQDFLLAIKEEISGFFGVCQVRG
ncbi:MAG TPA: anaerobic ribonucleoside-triphosphate reductase activating protein [Candidatus Paceibacterota bacterium]|nr:anaerobic ribonucleoside-triphosphate reductase activating protein [Candidatus Paceibacterota bacterium]